MSPRKIHNPEFHLALVETGYEVAVLHFAKFRKLPKDLPQPVLELILDNRNKFRQRVAREKAMSFLNDVIETLFNKPCVGEA